MSIILAFMVDTLKVSTSYKIPKIKCFDKNTMIKMNNGVHKKITEIHIYLIPFINFPILYNIFK